MIVKELLDMRKPTTSKVIRILDKDSKKNVGYWWENGNSNKVVKGIKATEKILFIFV